MSENICNVAAHGGGHVPDGEWPRQKLADSQESQSVKGESSSATPAVRWSPRKVVEKWPGSPVTAGGSSCDEIESLT